MSAFRRYGAAVRAKAVGLVASGGLSRREAAKVLGVDESSIRRWLAEARADHEQNGEASALDLVITATDEAERRACEQLDRALDQTLRAITEAVPKEASLRTLIFAYRVLAEQSARLRGQPSTITGQRKALDPEQMRAAIERLNRPRHRRPRRSRATGQIVG